MIVHIDRVISTLTYVIYSLSRLINTISDVPTNVVVKYNLYTPETKAVPIAFKNISEITLKPNRELKVLCHGWYSNNSREWYDFTIKEYLKSGNFNIITTDYHKAVNNSNLISQPSYLSKPLGVQIGKMLVDLDVQKKAMMRKVHLIGHLVGADIAGVAGETVFTQTGKLVGRITGLDPSFYFNAMPDNRLSPHDAAFVDTYNTIIGGRDKNVGKLDVYFYGMTCDFWSMKRGLASTFFDQTINNPKKLVGLRCADQKYFYPGSPCPTNTTATVGEHVNEDVFGRYYVNATVISKPFCNSTQYGYGSK